jgi:hypothetical protein
MPKASSMANTSAMLAMGMKPTYFLMFFQLQIFWQELKIILLPEHISFS